MKPLFALGVLTFVSQHAMWAGTVSGNVADYNAADVLTANGILVAPVGLATYNVTSTVAIGSQFIVTLPAGFTFGSIPALQGTGTFALSSGGLGQQSATFTTTGAPLTSGQSITLGTFTVDGAVALATVTPVASALPITMQIIGTDPSPLPFQAFASDVGAQAVYVGAIQAIDLSPPSLGTEFTGSPDSLTAVIMAIAIFSRTTDAATGTVPILNAAGQPNALSTSDTATVTISGNFGGIATIFLSTTSDCQHPGAQGIVDPLFGSAVIPNVPVGVEVFVCLTGSGQVLQSSPQGYPAVTVSPGTSKDFLAITAIDEFPGQVCYTTDSNNSFGDCSIPDMSLNEYFLWSFFFN